MAGEQDTWTYGYGIAVEDRRAVLDEAASSYTERDAIPSVPTPQNASALTVSTPGTVAPSNGTTLECRTQQGGLVGGANPATMVWRESAGDWLGHNELPMSAVATVIEAKSGGTYTATKDPAALTLPDGSVLVVCDAEHGGLSPQYRVSATIFAIDATTTTATVYGKDAAPAADGYRPTLCLLQSGRILCYSWWVDTGSNLGQIRCDYSDDSGETWAMASEAVLPEPIDVSATGYDTGHISAAAGDGGVMLVVHLINAAAAVSSYRDELRQYASRDFGQAFILVDKTKEGADTDALKAGIRPEVIHTSRGTFVAAWISPVDLWPYVQRVTNPFDSLFDQDPSTIAADLDRATASGSPVVGAAAALSLCEDHGGALYVNTQLPDASGKRAQQLHRSDDDGVEWKSIGYGSKALSGGAHWWSTEGTTLYVRDVAIAAQAGRTVAFCNLITSSGTYDASLVAIAIGGPSTRTLPPFQQADTRDTQVTWDYAWGGFGLNNSMGNTALTAISSPTITEGLRETTLVTTGSGSAYYTDTFALGSSPVASGAIVSQVIAVDAGGDETKNQVQLSMRIRDGSASYFPRIYLDGSGYTLTDNASGTIVTASTGLTPGTRYEFMMACAGGKVSAWYREHTWEGSARWTTIIENHTLTAGAVGPNEVLMYRGIVGTAATIRLGVFGVALPGYTGSQMVNDYNNPEMLHGRPWSRLGVPVGSDGVVVAARGHSVRGDEVHITPTSETPLSNALQGGARKGWEAAGTAEEVIVLDLQGGADTAMGSDVLQISAFGANIPEVKIYGVPASGADVLLADETTSANMESLPWQRSGDTIRPDVGAAVEGDTPTLALAEMAGSYFADGGDMVRLTGNRPGRYTREAARNRTVLYLDPATVGSLGSSGATGRIIPKNWAIAIDLHGREYEKIKIVIPASSGSNPAAPEGRWKIGRLHVGWVSLHAWQPSWGNRVKTEVLRQDIESRDVQRTSTELAPIRRTFRTGYVDGIRQYNVVNVTHNADGEWFNVSDHADAEGMGQTGMVLQTLEGILYETVSGTVPVVQVMYLPRFDGSTTACVLNRRDQIALTYMDSPVDRARVLGVDMHGELVRGDILEWTEAV